jgi:hypothetical protein
MERPWLSDGPLKVKTSWEEEEKILKEQNFSFGTLSMNYVCSAMILFPDINITITN